MPVSGTMQAAHESPMSSVARVDYLPLRAVTSPSQFHMSASHLYILLFWTFPTSRESIGVQLGFGTQLRCVCVLAWLTAALLQVSATRPTQLLHPARLPEHLLMASILSTLIVPPSQHCLPPRPSTSRSASTRSSRS